MNRDLEVTIGVKIREMREGQFLAKCTRLCDRAHCGMYIGPACNNNLHEGSGYQQMIYRIAVSYVPSLRLCPQQTENRSED